VLVSVRRAAQCRCVPVNSDVEAVQKDPRRWSDATPARH
jgi:hypothetical protein